MRHLVLLLIAAALAAGEARHPPQGQAMPFGPLVHYFVELPAAGVQPKQTVTKAIAVRLSDTAAMVFDSETLRYAATWTGGYVDMTATNVTRWVQGSGGAKVLGTIVAGTAMGPGIAAPAATTMGADPRLQGVGELPSAWGAYLGLYRHGDQVVFHYRIGERANACEVFDAPSALTTAGITVFTRTLHVSASSAAITLLVTEVADARGAVAADGVAPLAFTGEADGVAAGTVAWLDQALVADQRTAVRVLGAPAQARLLVRGGRIELRLPAHREPLRLTIAMTTGADAAVIGSALAAVPAPADASAWCRGGAARWPVQTTVGTRGADQGAYTIDTLALPSDNPWKSWIRPTAHDFFADGRLALATMAGDVWIASGIDEALGTITWKRFASGLFEPLGLKVVDGKIHVCCRDALVRLDDLNADGEADAYVALNRDIPVYAKYNDFTMDLATDRAGDFYLGKGGHGNPVGFPKHAAMIRIAKDGSRCEEIATGLRVPSGLGMGPGDLLTCADNQGNWVPVCRLNVIKPGRWYGYVGSPQFYGKNEPAHPAAYEPPLCWIPMAADNCPGSQVWAGKQWGPLSGAMLHLSYGQSTVLAVLHEDVGGVAQGGVVTMPLRFASGIMRARVSPKDGHLYLSGLKGWQTNAGSDGCLQRMRWNGKDAALPIGLTVRKGEVRLRFSAALDPDTVNADSVTAQRWNYAWTGAYGSPDVSVADPQQKVRDPVAISGVRLETDGCTVVISIPDLKPVMQQAIIMKFADVGGEAVTFTLYQTINVVP